MPHAINRRQMLLAAGAAAIGAGPLGRALAGPQGQGKLKKVLFFTKSSGFQHSVIQRHNGAMSHAEKILIEVGKENGYEVVASKDGRLFEPDKIGEWDAFFFQTTGDLTVEGPHKDGFPMSKEGKQAFLDAVAAGKGFVGTHCATDTFNTGKDTVDPYIKMIGGEFSGHDAQQAVRISVTDQSFPGVKAFGEGLTLNDEWYAQKNLADDLHVIIVQETKEMKGKNYQRPNFPETWARLHDKGKVFYTSMGHREDVWSNPLFQGLLVGALDWVTGKAQASVEPNVQKVTPEYAKVAS